MSDLETKLKFDLRSSEQNIPNDDLDALHAIRLKAVQQPMRKLPAFLAPAAGMIATSVVAMALIITPSYDDSADAILSAENNGFHEEMEFYEELDFYYWLASDETNLQGS